MVGMGHIRSTEIKYSMFINFEGRKDQLILQVSGNQIVPQLRLSK
jgi:hypothetical protein